MKNIVYLILHTAYFSLILLISSIFGRYIGPPLDWVDVVASIGSFALYLLVATLILKAYKNHGASRKVKLWLAAFAFLLAVILLASAEIIWFEWTGNMLY